MVHKRSTSWCLHFFFVNILTVERPTTWSQETYRVESRDLLHDSVPTRNVMDLQLPKKYQKQAQTVNVWIIKFVGVSKDLFFLRGLKWI